MTSDSVQFLSDGSLQIVKGETSTQVVEVGTQGPTGPQGPQGAVGPGVPSGGTAGQFIKKNSSTDYDTIWVDEPGVGLYLPLSGGTLTGDLTVNADIYISGKIADSASGYIDMTNGLFIATSSSSVTPLTVRATSGQSVPVVDIQNGSSNSVLQVTSSGLVNIISDNASLTPFTVKGDSAQSANMAEFVVSLSTPFVAAGVRSDGRMFAANPIDQSDLVTLAYADDNLVNVSGDTLDGTLSMGLWEELTGETPDGWPLIPFPNVEPHVPSQIFRDPSGSAAIGVHYHRAHIVYSILDKDGLLGKGTNMWFPFMTLASATGGGPTFMSGWRFADDPDSQGSLIAPYRTGIQTGNGTGMKLVADYTVQVNSNNVEIWRWGPSGLTVASGKSLTVGSDSVLLDVADSVDGTNIAANAVGTSELADSSVTTSKLADSSVTTLKLVDDSVTSDKLADGSVHANPQTVSQQTSTAYTLVLSDAGKLIQMDNASANTITVPANSSVAFPIGTRVDVTQWGAGTTTVAAAVGVTIRSEGGLLDLNAQYAASTLVKVATDEWLLVGSLA